MAVCGGALAAALIVLPSAAQAGNQIKLGAAGANAGTKGISIDVQVTNDKPIHAFSLAVTFDSTYLTLRSITDEGTATAQLKPDFFFPTINNTGGEAVLGVIFSYSEPISREALETSPDTPQRVAVLTFDIATDAPPGAYPIELKNGVGSPPVSNVFSNEGKTIQPELQNGALTVNNENILLLESANVQPGSRFEVRATSKHPATLQGYSIAVVYNTTILTFIDATTAGTAAAQAIKPQVIEFFQPQVRLDFDPNEPNLARLTVGAVLDSVPPFTGHEIPPSALQFQSLVRFTFDAKNNPALLGTVTEIVFHNAGVTDVNNIFIIDKQSYTPDTINSRISFTSVPLFRRGFINPDNRLDISDGIVVLSYLFLGEESPSCQAAADVNDDDRFDVSDAVAVFNYLFAGGAAPRDPFQACGTDPTPADLPCSRADQC